MYTEKPESIWPEWKLDETPIGRGSFGVVYRAVKEERGAEREAAVKIISVPSDDTFYDSLLPGAASALTSGAELEGLLNALTDELRIMLSLKGARNIVCVDDYSIEERKDRAGFRVFIRMELLTPVTKLFSSGDASEEEVIKLGRDVSSALEICESRGILHRDIKPQNVFANRFGDYKLGDFGMARVLEDSSGSLSLRGTPGYIAPEVWRGEPYDSRADIYSLGMVLYVLLNRNRPAFTDLNKQLLSPVEREEANGRRLAGEPLPAPVNASPELAAIILKACSPEPSDRFASASEFREALDSVGLSVSEVKPAPAEETSPKQARKKPVKKAVVFAAALAALLALAVILIVVLKNRRTAQRYSEAYSAYLDVLLEKKDEIDLYYWQNGYRGIIYVRTESNRPRPVALADVWGDEVPELIYVYGVETGVICDSLLCIATYYEGGVRTLYEEKLDDNIYNAGFYLFQTSESKNAFLYKRAVDPEKTVSDGYALITEFCEFRPTDGIGLDLYTVCSNETDYALRTNIYLDHDGVRITMARYNELAAELEGKTTGVLMFGDQPDVYGSINPARFEGCKFVEAYGCGDMDWDEAAAWLNGALGIEYEYVRYPFPAELNSVLPVLPLNFRCNETSCGPYSERLTLNADGSVSGVSCEPAQMSWTDGRQVYYRCEYSFRITELTAENDHVLSFIVTELKYKDEPGTEVTVTENGEELRCIAAESTSFRNGKRCLIFFPGTVFSAREELFRAAFTENITDKSANALDTYMIFVVLDGLRCRGFLSE